MVKSSSQAALREVHGQAMRTSLRMARRICTVPFITTLLTAAIAGCGGAANDVVSGSAPAKLAQEHATKSKPSADGPYAYSVISQVQPPQLSAFALFRTPPDRLPSTTERFLRKPIFGSNWSLARRIPVKAEGTYWLVPGNGYLCIISKGVMDGPGVNATCTNTAQAIMHGIATTSITPPGTSHSVRLIVGVAPDGTREALVHTRGAIAGVRVRHTAFALRDSIAAPPNFISFR
jgi:hypothetical protein